MALVAKSAGQEAYEEAEYFESIGKLLAEVSLLPSDFLGLLGAVMESESILLVWTDQSGSERPRKSPHLLSKTVIANKSRCMDFTPAVPRIVRVEYRFMLPGDRL